MKLTRLQSGSKATLLVAGLAMTFANMHVAQAQVRRAVLPTGTVIPVKLNQNLSSKNNRAGDTFTGTVVYGRDDAGLPEGTRVEGVVREALPHSGNKPGVLDVDFRRMIFPDGQTQSLDGSLYALDNKSVTRSESGRLVATGDQRGKDRLKWVGIGAGAGLLLSTLTKGNTLTSVLLGAGAGYLYNELAGNKKPNDVELKSGTEFGVRLDRQLAYNFDERRYGRDNRDIRDSRDRDYRDNDNYRDNRDNRDNRDDRYYRSNDQGSGRRTNDRYDRDMDRNDIGMIVNDRNVSFGSAKPFMRDGVVFVPLEPAARAANFRYEYNADDQVIKSRDGSLRLNMDSRIVTVNGERKRLSAAPMMRNGTLYVPSQFLAIATGGTAYWDAPSHTVLLTTERDR